MAFSKEAFEAYIESDGSVPFDIYAQNPDDFAALSARIPGLIVASAGGAYPFQAEGLLLGYPFYYRSEWGYASLSIGQLDGEGAFLNDVIYYAEVEGELNPENSSGEGSELTKRIEPNFFDGMLALVPLLEKSDYCYKFAGKKFIFSKSGSKSGYTIDPNKVDYTYARGFTAEEAYEWSRRPMKVLTDMGWSEEFQIKMWEDHEYSPIPVEDDTRVFPEVKPDFKVLY